MSLVFPWQGGVAIATRRAGRGAASGAMRAQAQAGGLGRGRGFHGLAHVAGEGGIVMMHSISFCGLKEQDMS